MIDVVVTVFVIVALGYWLLYSKNVRRIKREWKKYRNEDPFIY